MHQGRDLYRVALDRGNGREPDVARSQRQLGLLLAGHVQGCVDPVVALDALQHRVVRIDDQVQGVHTRGRGEGGACNRGRSGRHVAKQHVPAYLDAARRRIAVVQPHEDVRGRHLAVAFVDDHGRKVDRVSCRGRDRLEVEGRGDECKVGHRISRSLVGSRCEAPDSGLGHRGVDRAYRSVPLRPGRKEANGVLRGFRGQTMENVRNRVECIRVVVERSSGSLGKMDRAFVCIIFKQTERKSGHVVRIRGLDCLFQGTFPVRTVFGDRHGDARRSMPPGVVLRGPCHRHGPEQIGIGRCDKLRLVYVGWRHVPAIHDRWRLTGSPGGVVYAIVHIHTAPL